MLTKKRKLKFQNPKFPNSPIQIKIKFQNPNPKAFTKFHKSKHPKIPDSLTQKCVSIKCVWTLDPLQNQKHAPKSLASTKSQPRLKIQNNIISLQSQGPPVACFWMPKEGCIKNQFVQGGNGLDFVEEIGGGIIYIYHNTPKILGQRNIFQTFLEPSRFARVDSGPEPAFSLTPGTRKCTLPATNSLPLIGLPNRKGSSSNHPFSGETTVSLREGNMKGCDLGW